MSVTGAASAGRRRRKVFIGILLAVIAVHLLVAQRWSDEFGDWGSSGEGPTRLSVAYVREMEQSAPPTYAPGATASAASPRWRLPQPPDSAASQAAAREAAEKARKAAQAEREKREAARKAAERKRLEAARQRKREEQRAAARELALREEAERLAREDAAQPAALAADRAQQSEAAASAVAAAASTPDSTGVKAVASESTRAEEANTPSAEATGASAPSVAATSPTGAASAPGARPFEWPASTRLSYVLTGNYRGEVHGSAQVEWIREGSRYQVHLDVIVGADFAPFFQRQMTSDGVITPQGLAPRRYDEESKRAFSSKRVATVRIEGDQVQLADGSRVPRPLIAPGTGLDSSPVQDSASQFVQLTWLFSTRPDLLTPGRSIPIPLALAKSADEWTYDVIGPETLSTPFGALEAVHLKPRRLDPAKAAKANALSAEVWFAPTLAYLPVRIVIHQDESTYIDLMINRLPQMAAPAGDESARNR